MTTTKRTRMSATASVLALLLAACGGGEQADTAAPSKAGSATEDEGVDVAGAQAVVDRYSAAPEGLGLDEPLSATPPTDKYMITLETPQPVSKEKNDAIAEASALLGWKYERIQLEADAEAAPRAFAQALERRPDIVHYSGTPAALVSSQLAQAEAQGVLAISDSNTDPVQPPLISTSLDAAEQVAAWGEMSGAYVVASSGKKTRAAVFTIEAYPILDVYTKSFQETVMKYCPSCEVEVVNQQIADLGQKTPGSVVSTVQRSPDTEWAIFSFGDLALGVPAALRGAGLQDKVKIGGETPSAANHDALRKGEEAFWTAFPTSILGWRVVDMAARHFVGDDLAPANAALLPTQILTPDNVEDALFDESSGSYVGVPDFKDHFTQLWKLG